MRKRWLLIGVAVLTAALALGAVACEDDEDDGDSAATEPAGETPADGETPAAGATEPAAGGDSVEVTINEVEGSGVTGTATLTPTDAGFDVEVTVDGGLEPGSHASHIHQGSTCAAPTAPVVEALGNVEADDSGAGVGTITITTSELTSFQDGNSYVAVHALDGAVVGCGDIPSA